MLTTPAWPLAGNNYPVLPGRFQRSDVERILTAVSAALGLSPARLRALLVMIQATRPSDWTRPNHDAVCYLRQIDLAARLGITPRALRDHEAGLEAAGLIRREYGADGGRGRFRGGELIQGISFSPLIERFPELVALLDRCEAERGARQFLRRKCSAAKRMLTRSLGRLLELAPRHGELPGLLRILKSMPRRYDGLSVAELTEVFAQVDETVRQALDLLEMLPQTSGVAEESCRRHRQETTEEFSVSEECAEVRIKAPRSSDSAGAGERKLSDAGPRGVLPVGKTRAGGNGAGPLTPDQLYRMCSPSMRLYLDAVKQGSGPPSEHDFVQAAIGFLPEIDVHPSAWDEAVEIMGDFGAALCVILVDANRFRPMAPVRVPGAMLRAMTRLAPEGRLNLEGALSALRRRALSVER